VRDLVDAQMAIVVALDDPRIVATGPDLSLDANATRVIGMALHELCTNACKYGALSLLSGQVHITWAVEGADRCTMAWVERGGPGVTPPSRVGFGRRVVELMVMNSTNGTVNLVFSPEGVEWHFSAPLSAILA